MLRKVTRNSKGGGFKTKMFKGKNEAKLKFSGGRFIPKLPSVQGVWMFSGTVAQSKQLGDPCSGLCQYGTQI